MSADLKPTVYFDNLVQYWHKAKQLQDWNIGSPTGRDPADPAKQIDDPLMQWVTIYDCVERRYAGFSNALQQVWFGSENPKRWQARREFDGARGQLSEVEWLYVFFVHRITGSGASFAKDHGFRNSIVPDLVRHRLAFGPGPGRMPDYVLQQMRERPIFTSIGNQIPAFPKPVDGYARGGELYLHRIGPKLVFDAWQWMRHEREVQGRPLEIADTVDNVAVMQQALGLRVFWFQLTAWVMDIAEYFPELVDPNSRVHYGKNCIEAFNLMFEHERRRDFYDTAMRHCIEAMPSQPMSMEDCCCDSIRYVEGYVPKGYEHLEAWQIENRSLVPDHPKHFSNTRHPSRLV